MGLFGPAYKSKNEGKALKALECIHDTNTVLGISVDPAVNFLSSQEDFLRVHRQYPRLNRALAERIHVQFQSKGWDFVIPLVEQWEDLSLVSVFFSKHFLPEVKAVIPESVYRRAVEQVTQNPADPNAGPVTVVLKQAGYLL